MYVKKSIGEEDQIVGVFQRVADGKDLALEIKNWKKELESSKDLIKTAC